MTDQNRRSLTLETIPLDLLLAVLGALIAYIIVLENPGFRPDGRGPTFVVNGVIIELSLLAVIGSIAGLVLLLFLPGYAYTAAVFPNPSGARPDNSNASRSPTKLTTLERVALSFGMSVSFVALLGLAMAALSIPYSTAVSGLVVFVGVYVGAAIGTARGHVSLIKEPRKQLRRLAYWAVPHGHQSTREWIVSAVLALSILLALSTVSLGLVVPSHGEAYTGFSLLVGTEGGAVAADYPTTMAEIGTTPMVLLIQNREGVATSYTIVIEEEIIERGSEGITNAADNELARVTLDVPVGGSERHQISVTPTMDGSELRIAFYLYRGEGPPDATAATAYRHLYVWVGGEAPPTGAQPSN